MINKPNLISRIYLGAVLVFLPLSRLSADEIILKDGKSLTGKITKEDENEYTIRLKQNMYLRVEKSNVQRAIRSPEKKERNVIRMVPGSSKSKVPSTSTSTVKSSTPVPNVLNVAPVAREQQRTKNNIQISEIIVYKTYPVTGKDLVEIREEITDPEKGKGIPAGRRRAASDTVWEPSWRGDEIEGAAGAFKWKTAVAQATVTVTLPVWKAPTDPDASSVTAWNKFIAQTESYEIGRIRIYNSGLDNFSQALHSLVAESEEDLKRISQQLFETMKMRAQKRQQGYLRRTSRRTFPLRKP